MEYFLIYKTDKKNEMIKPLVLNGGYNFKKSISITLYNREMVRYILKKKLNTSLKKIINLYLVIINGDGEEESGESLLPRIELLRKVLLEDYAYFLDKDEIENYLIKLEKMEKKVGSLQFKKSRHM